MGDRVRMGMGRAGGRRSGPGGLGEGRCEREGSLALRAGQGRLLPASAPSQQALSPFIPVRRAGKTCSLPRASLLCFLIFQSSDFKAFCLVGWLVGRSAGFMSPTARETIPCPSQPPAVEERGSLLWRRSWDLLCRVLALCTTRMGLGASLFAPGHSRVGLEPTAKQQLWGKWAAPASHCLRAQGPQRRGLGVEGARA